MNGVGWFGELGNLLVMPTTGPLQKIAGKEDGSIAGYRSHYDKTTETARAGYYAADLTDYGIRSKARPRPTAASCASPSPRTTSRASRSTWRAAWAALRSGSTSR